MPVNKVVVHDKEGNIIKGTTADFLPKKPMFHLAVGGMHGDQVKEVFVETLKAVFFVKDFNGNKEYREKKDFEAPQPGKRVKALFQDGETMCGYTHVLNFDQPGFFLVPADPKCNNERVYAVYSFLQELVVNDSPVDLKSVLRKR